jgi:hypothetical protein
MTIFTFGLSLWTTKNAPWQLLLIPSLWSFIGFNAAIMLGVKEDFVLPIVAVIGVAMLLAVKREQMIDWMGRRKLNDPLRHRKQIFNGHRLRRATKGPKATSDTRIKIGCQHPRLNNWSTNKPDE